MASHKKIKCFESENAKLICVHRETNREIRRKISRDLNGSYNPPCNKS
jgi:hypothetical protein